MSSRFIFSGLLAAVLQLLGIPLSGQCIRQDEWPAFRKTDAGVYNNYDELAPKVTTAVPEGYVVAGVSHYGRHGSRYATEDYLETDRMLEEMHREKKLSLRGEQVYAAYHALMPYLAGREGELTQLGRRQHRGIAGRMFKAYPGLFIPNAVLTARSTLVPRCIESMGAFCEQMARLCPPDVEIVQEASAYYLGEVSAMQDYVHHYKVSYKEEAKAVKKEWEKKLLKTGAFGRMLCGSSLVEEKDLRKLARNLQAVWFSVPFADDCDSAAVAAFLYAIDGVSGTEKGARTILPPLFDDETWAQLGQVNLSRHWSELNAPILHHGVMNIFMVERILRMADEDLAAGRPFVRLRFGHDTILQCILKDCGVRGWQAWEEWSLSRIPMASNLQLVFYRKDPLDGALPAGGDTPDILFKILLNESELELPIPAVCGRNYSWAAFKDYMIPRIRDGKARARSYLKYPYPI